MAKKKNADKPAKRFLKGIAVLQEVYDKLSETGKPVDVTCWIAESFTVEDVINFLMDLKIEVDEDPGNHTDTFVFAKIHNVRQAEKVDKVLKQQKRKCIRHVFLDKDTESCVEQSQYTINAPAARNLFEVDGHDIHWAVIDSGIDIKHDWLKSNCSQSRRNDYTGEGLRDVGSHGTHVAGIITKIAPRVILYDYKVLKSNGKGKSSWTIKAMYEVRKINFNAGRTVIHGVNISLGGRVPVYSYGCGWSPECIEANRLMNSGVIVCSAAGNDGYKFMATVVNGELDIFSTYLDMGILDPGNAEEVITVGSTHKKYPHRHGPSFFSSKGPTGDGRVKPDCLAPGEKILSARAGGGTIEMDGTSMATPHVSGAIILFLSAKPDFIGQTKEVKKILLDACTNLNRDRNFQGSGLVDVLRMIQSI